MNIGTVLRSWRHHEEMSLEQAAKKIGLPLSTLDRVEKGSGIENRTMVVLIHFLFEEQTIG